MTVIEVSGLYRCPYYRGVRIKEVPILQRFYRGFRTVEVSVLPRQSLCKFWPPCDRNRGTRCPYYRGVYITEVSVL